MAIVLLASGNSRRMGQNKLILPWRHHTVLAQVCETVTNGVAIPAGMATPPWVAVTGTYRESIDPIVQDYGFSVVHNDSPHVGQGYSLALAMDYVMTHFYNIEGVLCVVGDQPLLSTCTVERLVATFTDTYQEKRIVQPLFGPQHIPGNPVLFGSYWFSYLQHIDGDQGGRTILKGEGQPYTVPVLIAEDEHIDIDTMDVYERIRYSKERCTSESS